MMNGQKFCLKWDHFRTSVTSVFNNLRQDEELVDITLCCEGHRIKAHRMMLSACSPYFRELLKENPCQHPVFFLKDTSAEDLRAVIEFVYNGEVNVAQTQLASFIKTAEMLQIRGLSGEDEDASSVPVSSGGPAADRRPPPSERPRSPPAKRRRRSGSPPEAAGRPAATAAVPPPPPPPPPPPAPLSRVPPQPLHTPPQSQQLGELATAEQPRLPPQSPADIKVEKVDLTEPEDDPSLEAALGRVVSYEGADGGELSALTTDDPLGEAGPSAGLAADRSAQAGPGPPPPQSAVMHAGLFVCVLCGRTYRSRDSFRHHIETHAGKTTCPHCRQTFATVSSRNRHAAGCYSRPRPAPSSWQEVTPEWGPTCGRGAGLGDTT